MSKKIVWAIVACGVAGFVILMLWIRPAPHSVTYDVVVSNLEIPETESLFLQPLSNEHQLVSAKPALPRPPQKPQPQLLSPMHLAIPVINLNASLGLVGLTPDGAVGAPQGASQAAWFNLSARPGQLGSAVITGHYGTWKNGEGSVFDNLNKLTKGDKMYVKDQLGAVVTFLVREIKTYEATADAPEIFFLDDGKSHLNLITCQGIWSGSKKTYSDRLVVFADKEM